MYTGAGTAAKQYYHANYQGSIIAMTDSAGVAVDIYTYDPHGNSTTLTGNPFRYTGRRLDAETGLYYYRARYYSPALGRFLQTDPIGYGDGLNWYAYVGNDPVNGVDPSGECKTETEGVCRTVVKQSDKRFETPQEAFKSVAQETFDISTKEDVELGGTIFEDGETGDFGASEVITNDDPNGVDPDDAVTPEGTTAVETFHSHGAPRRDMESLQNEDFSKFDIDGINETGTPGNLITPRGTLKTRGPGDNKSRTIGTVKTHGKRKKER